MDGSGDVTIDVGGEKFEVSITLRRINMADVGGGKMGKKAKKEKSGKTRKLSPYMKFAQEARKNILADHPEWKSDIIKVGKEIGTRWRAMSDAEKAKY